MNPFALSRSKGERRVFPQPARRISLRSPNVDHLARGNLLSCGTTHSSNSWHNCTAWGTVGSIVQPHNLLEKFIRPAESEAKGQRIKCKGLGNVLDETKSKEVAPAEDRPQLRYDARRASGSSPQEPPRITRWPQVPRAFLAKPAHPWEPLGNSRASNLQPTPTHCPLISYERP